MANNADQPWLLVNRDPVAAGQDNAYVAYDEFTNNLSRVSVSTGTTPVAIVRDVAAGNASPEVTNPGLRMASDPRNGTMYALYQTSTGANQPRTVTYHLNRSTDAGQTWTLNGNTDGIAVDTVPSSQLQFKFAGVNDLRGGVDHAAVDPTNGDVYVVYGHDTASTGTGNQLEIRRITTDNTGTATVGAASVVSNAASAALPSVAVAADGTIGVLYDTDDGTNASGFPIISAHFARSTDHGVTFTDQVLQTFNSPVLPSGSNTDRQRILGDYQQLKVLGRTFYGVYSGNRTGFRQHHLGHRPHLRQHLRPRRVHHDPDLIGEPVGRRPTGHLHRHRHLNGRNTHRRTSPSPATAPHWAPFALERRAGRRDHLHPRSRLPHHHR